MKIATTQRDDGLLNGVERNGRNTNMKPGEDGITHINVYSKGKTELGVALSNFTYAPFIHPEDGEFNYVEGYWYWLGCKDDRLRKLCGYKAKELGRELRAKDWREDEETKRKVRLALDAKIKQDPLLQRLLKESSLPFEHYYVYGDKLVEVKKGRWVLEHIELIRKNLNDE